MAKKPKIGKTPILGGKKDGARPSVKHQVSGKTKGTTVSTATRGQSSRGSRIAKMEKMDPAC